jgi:hypothetical protein
MSRFLKVFLRVPLTAGVEVAGFGKHPAWDDHIDDIGLKTETLVLAKQLLYSEGITTQLASGAWDQLEKSGNAIEFDHRFVWGRDQQAIVGAIWASADRKGRTRFPLVVCAQIASQGPRAIDLLFDSIERLGALCRAAKNQEDIRDAFRRAKWEFSGANLPGPSDNRSSEMTDAGQISILSSLVTLSAGLKNRRPRDAAKTSGSHFRLSAISSKAKENLNFWSTYLTTQHIGSNPPYVIIASNGKGWIDLIIGEPVENDFYCLRAHESALPVTSTEIEAKQLRKLESEAKEYLQTYQFGSLGRSMQRRAWWSGLFSNERGS